MEAGKALAAHVRVRSAIWGTPLAVVSAVAREKSRCQGKRYGEIQARAMCVIVNLQFCQMQGP